MNYNYGILTFLHLIKCLTQYLIWVIHHSNEKIEKDNDVDDRESPKHHKTPESRKLLFFLLQFLFMIYDREDDVE